VTKKGLPEASWKCDLRYQRRIFLVDKNTHDDFLLSRGFLQKAFRTVIQFSKNTELV